MPISKKRLLVTGASGFVGQHVLAMCSDYDCIGTFHSHLPEKSYAHVTYRPLDMRHAEDVESTIQEILPDVILHLAGHAHSWNASFEDVFETHVYGTRALYDAIVTCRILSPAYNPRILYVSSADVYGTSANRLKEGDGLTENDLLMPISLYGMSKVSADRLTYMYAQRNKMDIVIARPFAHVGSGQRLGFFVPDMISQIKALENDSHLPRIIRVGNLESIRDYTDVRDVVHAYRLLMSADCERGEVFNICSGKGIKMSSLLESILKNFPFTIDIAQDPSRLRPSDLPIYVGSAQKLHNLTGWKPEISIERMIRDAL